MKSQDIKPGVAVIYDGSVYVCVSTEHVKPGKGPAYVQAKFRNVKLGGQIEKRLRSGEELEQAHLSRRELEYLYTDGTGAVFMDVETFDQLPISREVLGDALLYLKPNSMLSGLVHEGNVIVVDLPPVVELTVTDTPPEIKGASAVNQPKEATCETGLRTRVPAFISIGEVIKVSTETGEYLGRA